MPAESHKAPDGLSRRAHAEEDTDNSSLGEDIDHYGPFITNSKFPFGELAIEPLQRDTKYIALTKLQARHGEAVDTIRRRRGEELEVLQLASIEPELNVEPEKTKCNFTLINARAMSNNARSTGIVGATTRSQIIGTGKRESEYRHPSKPESDEELIEDTQFDKLILHPNHILDDDRDSYWQNIIGYLQTFKVPAGVTKRKTFIQATRKYFLYGNALWRRTKNIPRRVILNKEERKELIREAHDESGHRGRDPTYKKLSDFYFWPNMLAEIAIHCRTCRQCQLRSSYHPKVMINPTWVPTVLRKFNMDIVEMGIISAGYSYIVDIRDDLTGWIEARMLARKSAESVADFLWQDVICRFGCIPQVTTDNGKEFEGVLSILMKRYGITAIKTSPYNPAANGMIERGHRTWINSIWKLCGKRKDRWSRWFYHALWADRVTTKRTTGFSPYYLLYGRPHLFPFNLRDETWYTINWHDIGTTEELIAVRALQIKQLHMDRTQAAKKNKESRIRAAHDYAIKNAGRLISGQYRKGEFVIVALKGPGIARGIGRAKSDDTWAGPFRIYKRHKSGSYQLRELDGTIVRGSVPASHLKPFYTKENTGKNIPMEPGEESSEDIYPFQKSDEEEDHRDPDFQIGKLEGHTIIAERAEPKFT
jgi:hypothetical protein